MITRRALLAGAGSLPLLRGASGAVPSERQLRWHELETTAFLHFTINTFTDKEWGYGDEDPNLFQPAKFDPDAIVGALADAGMRGVILTAKHHDGFCLWPTDTTGHSIRKTSWRGGKGDVVRDIAEAARRKGLQFGVYLSPWDRNSAAYGTPKYIELYRAQLTELLTHYGPIFEVWHDGANGGDGYYGGAREKRTIDKRTYYDWPNTWALIRKLQPDAVIFSDVGPDVRWVGNERGIAGDPCWSTYDPVAMDGGPASPGDVRSKESPTGTRNGSRWLPAECDVSIRPGWFWHENQNARVKTPAQLIDLYYKSVGRGATLLLNVPPNRDGLLSPEDVASLKAFGDYRRKTFGKPVAVGKNREIDAPAAFNVIRLREDIRQGQRIDSVVVERLNGNGWVEVASATSVGPRRLIRLDQPVRAAKLRARVTQSSAPPVLREFAVFSDAGAANL
jgi:alpha-L-fucosidase